MHQNARIGPASRAELVARVLDAQLPSERRRRRRGRLSAHGAQVGHAVSSRRLRRPTAASFLDDRRFTRRERSVPSAVDLAVGRGPAVSTGFVLSGIGAGRAATWGLAAVQV